MMTFHVQKLFNQVFVLICTFPIIPYPNWRPKHLYDWCVAYMLLVIVLQFWPFVGQRVRML